MDEVLVKKLRELVRSWRGQVTGDMPMTMSCILTACAAQLENVLDGRDPTDPRATLEDGFTDPATRKNVTNILTTARKIYVGENSE